MPNEQIYAVTLPQGTIAIRNGIFVGSHTEAQWAPCNPDVLGGWNDGDILKVSCTFNLDPDTNPKPPASDYYGLCIGACAIHDSGAVRELKHEARFLGGQDQTGTVLGNHISQDSSRTERDIFYKCRGKTVTIPLQPTNRGTLENYYYYWEMTYNGENTVVNNGEDVEIVFGYGDPQFAESET